MVKTKDKRGDGGEMRVNLNLTEKEKCRKNKKGTGGTYNWIGKP